MTNDLLSRIRQLDDELREEMRERWSRDLPFQELVTDRWERARRLGFEEGTTIYQSAYVMFDVRVGRNTWIGPMVMLDGRGGLEIGANCNISTGVQIYTHDSVRRTLTGGDADFETGAVTIGDNTYVGSQSVVLQGVTIGDHCVVGAGSLVTGDVPPYTIVFGSPARVRGRVLIGADGDATLQMDDEG